MVLKCGAKIQSSHISAFYGYNNSLWDRNLAAHIGDTLYHGSCDTFNKTFVLNDMCQHYTSIPRCRLQHIMFRLKGSYHGRANVAARTKDQCSTDELRKINNITTFIESKVKCCTIVQPDFSMCYCHHMKFWSCFQIPFTKPRSYVFRNETRREDVSVNERIGLKWFEK